jgi:hypothetical protein
MDVDGSTMVIGHEKGVNVVAVERLNDNPTNSIKITKLFNIRQSAEARSVQISGNTLLR